MSKLFDFIHHHGCEIAEKRAQRADPAYAERYAARHVKPGIVLGTEGPGGLDGFFADMKLTDRYRPWWHKVALHMHWWAQKHGIRPTLRQMEHRRQRVSRGWSDRDTWSLDHHLSTVIRDSVRHLRDNTHGYPGTPDVPTFEDWQRILDEIADGMQAHLDIMDILKTEPHEHAALEAKRDLAFDHLKKYWGSLWD